MVVHDEISTYLETVNTVTLKLWKKETETKKGKEIIGLSIIQNKI